MKRNFKTILFYILLIGVIALSVSSLLGQTKQEKLIYSDIVDQFKTDSVVSFVVDESYNLTMVIVDPEKATYDEQTGKVIAFGENDVKQISYQLRSLDLFHTDLEGYIASNNNLKEYDYEPQKSYPWWISMVPSVIVIVIVIVLWFVMMNQATGGKGGKINSFGKAHVKTPLPNDKNKVRFTDVAGADEEKAELQEIVDFLKDPAKFTALGARIPHGVLLVGPPGTGKTLLAKAVAGEAGVPFFSISGSDFVEMYVGVGASRVRDLFENARKTPASIIFIDEIDAVGRHRGAGLGGGHDEREQTLNQLLVEMDGFGSHEGIIVIAATNRPDILDPALLRPGRFDRQVTVNYPDIKGREEILKVHARNKPLENTVDLAEIAKTTAGFTGADLSNLLNEAALLAARRHKSLIGPDDISEAFIKVIAGPKKKSMKIKDSEKKKTAYHEAGHAILAYCLPTQDPVQQISIIPSGNALGYTLNPPAEDRYSVYKQELKEKIAMLLGGRAAEEIVFGDVSGGASNDIQRATATAKKMVTQLGMSDLLGPINYASEQGEVFLGRDFSAGKDHSEDIAAKIDSEVHKIISESYKLALDTLRTNLDKLNLIADFLVAYEVMDGDQFKAAMEGTPTIEELDEMRKEKKRRSEEENKKRAEEIREEEARKKAEEEARANAEAEQAASGESPAQNSEDNASDEEPPIA
ncbi:MAG: ATP-dependent zinc metalloprotease FtsH [Clostridia bacterium]|nr:ATP-dependent zinc metalloprotease FtsH [Clostridia bacterium]